MKTLILKALVALAAVVLLAVEKVLWRFRKANLWIGFPKPTQPGQKPRFYHMSNYVTFQNLWYHRNKPLKLWIDDGSPAARRRHLSHLGYGDRAALT